MISWLEAAIAQQEYMTSLRRDFHMHPELGFEEVRSSGIIQQELDNLGIPLEKNIAKTGVVGIINGARPGKTVLLRFDMDALALQEETGLTFQSRTPGKMHACGHDGHMAIGLGVAKLLSAKRSELPGKIKLVFQPAEEGAGGAARMIAEGILNSPKPDHALGIHIWNEKPLGWLGITPGAIMAGADFFEVRIEGRGGHGAIPEKTADPIVTSAMIINALQSVISRNVSPRDCGVVSITQVRGGDTYNVIPGSVELKGTIRSFQKDVHDLLVSRIEDITSFIARSMHCEAKINWIMSDPPLVNDPFVTNLVFETAKSILPNHTTDQNYQSMGSEDMALIQEKIPGCYIYIGSANTEKGLIFGHHHPKFNFDEIVLSQAAALIAGSAADLLNQA